MESSSVSSILKVSSISRIGFVPSIIKDFKEDNYTYSGGIGLDYAIMRLFESYLKINFDCQVILDEQGFDDNFSAVVFYD